MPDTFPFCALVADISHKPSALSAQTRLDKAKSECGIHAGAQGRRVLHVQSISRWAPCCIGPYSQATTLGSLLHMAGQIGLDPATMQLVSAGLRHQLIRYDWPCC